MDRAEFYLRLLLMRGKVLNKLRILTTQLFTPVVAVEPLLQALQLTPLQVRQFYQVDEQRLHQALSWLDLPNHHLVTYHQASYPPLLREISSAPLLLFVQGEVQNLILPQLAMVGSRRYSQYGYKWGYHFAYQLATKGMAITSGLALGIDALCHQAALAAKGRTIAVLGSGLNQLTPRSHTALAKRMLAHQGTLVSEFLPDTPAVAMHFPRRNRIISGLSWGVMIVEAARKSGSLITARYALEQGREVFALPGPIDNEGCAGTHWLIQQGANLVTQPTEIIEQYNSRLHWLPLLTSPKTRHLY